MTTPNPYGPPAPGAYPAPGAARGGYPPPPPSHGAPAWSGAPAGIAAPAAAPGVPAPLGRRAAAYAIDVAVVVAGYAVLWLTTWLLARSLGAAIVLVMSVVIALLALAWFGLYSLMQGGHGSIGMRVTRLRLVRLEDGAPLGFGRALLRNVIWGLASAILVGFFSVLFDRTGRNQGWHDKVANAFMSDAAGAHAAAPAAFGPPAAAAPSTPAAPAAPAPPVPPASPVTPAYAAAPAHAAPAAPTAPELGGIPPRPPLPPQPRPAAAGPPQAAQWPAAPAVPPSPDGLIAYVPGITQDPPAAAAAAPAAADDVDGDTILVRPVAEPEPEPDLEDTRLVSRPAPAVLEWDDGTRHTVGARSVFGRNPAAEDGAEAVVVRDETLSLSKTHFEIEVTADAVSVLDRHSTNGVTIVREGTRIAADAGERLPLEPGDALEIGDRIVTYRGRG
jgi:hypothetical protein